MNKKNGYTKDEIRYYKCKLCGNKIQEPLYIWKKKHQSQKNICEKCLENIKIISQTRSEINEDLPY